MKLNAQGFLHTQGKNIVDGNGENFIIRGIGTGNWMIQEGYMMQSAGIAGTQHEFREKLIQTIGIENTNNFYESWLSNHFTRTDADSLAAWGFNTIRVAMHYKWLTLPIEEESIPGQQTWLEPGFILLDSLLSWCAVNQMHLILDMHGAPGGQGKDADISDYDDTKPSLWESEANKTKLVALWYKLAERYGNEPWIGGYDLINETNWSFGEENNSPLKNLFKRISDTIRLVDQNHIIFIEGNWFANDFGGLTPPWDNNIAYSFHKYWSYNDKDALNWVISLRDQYNVPIWLGESGENSNTWYTNLISLAENNNIGWSWWPVKKVGNNNPLMVKINSDYVNLIKYWRGQVSAPSVNDAYQAVMKFSDNHRFENCSIQKDVIDAMFRQVSTTKLKAFLNKKADDYIFASDYALGKNGYAYFDTDTANYHLNTDEYTSWNIGGAYRNDGVDIQECNDADISNGYNVGWIEEGEWMVYIIQSDSTTLFDCTFRSASKDEGGYVQLEANGQIISNEIYLPPTGDWENWRSTKVENIIIPEGRVELKFKLNRGAANLNYIHFNNPRSVMEADFLSLLCETSEYKNEIYLHLNEEITSEPVSKNGFELFIDNQTSEIISVEKSSQSENTLILTPAQILNNSNQLAVSYNGSEILSKDKPLQNFSKKQVVNNLAEHYNLPVKIEAEDYYKNFGFDLENCSDEGGGYNTAYSNPGDYLDYLINVSTPGKYQLDLRVALKNGNAKINLWYEKDDVFTFLKTINLLNTGDWQNWTTQLTSVSLPKGKYRFRIEVQEGEFNLNWIFFSLLNSVNDLNIQDKPIVYPNPAHDFVNLVFSEPDTNQKKIEISDIHGSILLVKDTIVKNITIDTSSLCAGIYFIRIYNDSEFSCQKLMIN